MVDININNTTVSEPLPVANLIREKRFDDLANGTDIVEASEFGDSGNKWYVIDNGDNVNQYNLSTPYDISTATQSGSFNVGTQEPNPESMVFKSDGTKFYIGGTSSDQVFAYDLSTAWDISTATHNSESYDPSELSNVYAFDISNDGTTMWLSTNNKTFYEYDLSTAWDVSSASSVGSNVISEISNLRQLKFFDSGNSALVQNSNRVTYRLDLSTPYEFSQYTINSSLRHSKFKGYGYVTGFNGDGTEITYIFPGGSPQDSAFTLDLKNAYNFEAATVPDGEIWDVNMVGTSIRINGARIGSGSVDAILRSGQSFRAESGVITGFKVKEP